MKISITDFLKKIAPKLGATLILEPEFEYAGQIRFPNGKKHFFKRSRFNINPLGAVEISKDKQYAKFFLQQFGYKTIEGQTFFSEGLNLVLNKKRTIDDGYVYAKSLGFPVIVKPNDSSHGKWVQKVYHQSEYYEAARTILANKPVLLVERFYVGNDYRIVILDGQLIAAYQRVSLSVSGNGIDNIEQLLNKKKQALQQAGRQFRVWPKDARIAAKLAEQGLGWQTIPKLDEQIFLLSNANLSTGGEAIDITQTIHSDYVQLAQNICRDMQLQLCGVDILTQDATQALSDYAVVEINSAPGLRHYATLHPDPNAFIEAFYTKVLQVIAQQ